MFGPRLGGSIFSLAKVLGGISKTLGVVNQVIPIYKEAKPMIQNAKNAMNILKEFGNNATQKVMTNTEKNIRPIKEKISNTNLANFNSPHGPTFFQ